MKTLNYEYTDEYYVKGKATGKQESLLLVLKARGIQMTEADIERIHACMEKEMLDRWIERAVTADSVAALFQ